MTPVIVTPTPVDAVGTATKGDTQGAIKRGACPSALALGH